LGLPVVGSSKNRGCETIRLWTALVDLDKYAQRLQAKWVELPEDIAAEARERMETVLSIVKDAESLKKVLITRRWMRKWTQVGIWGRVAKFAAQLISVKLEQVIVALQLLMLDKAVSNEPRGTS